MIRKMVPSMVCVPKIPVSVRYLSTISSSLDFVYFCILGWGHFGDASDVPEILDLDARVLMMCQSTRTHQMSPRQMSLLAPLARAVTNPTARMVRRDHRFPLRLWVISTRYCAPYATARIYPSRKSLGYLTISRTLTLQHLTLS